jgi:hypothetical protein
MADVFLIGRSRMTAQHMSGVGLFHQFDQNRVSIEQGANNNIFSDPLHRKRFMIGRTFILEFDGSEILAAFVHLWVYSVGIRCLYQAADI